MLVPGSPPTQWAIPSKSRTLHRESLRWRVQWLLLGRTVAVTTVETTLTAATPHLARLTPKEMPPHSHHPGCCPSRSMHPTLQGKTLTSQASQSQARGSLQDLGKGLPLPGLSLLISKMGIMPPLRIVMKKKACIC